MRTVETLLNIGAISLPPN